MESGLRDRNNAMLCAYWEGVYKIVSMKSGLRDRNNEVYEWFIDETEPTSQWSPVLETGTIPQ